MEHDSVAYVVRVVGSNAYKGCSGLEQVTTPATVDSIGNSAFAGCLSLRRVDYKADSCRYMGQEDSCDEPDRIPVYIPRGSRASYEARWPRFTHFVEEAVSDSVAVRVSDSTMGSTWVATQPTCDNRRQAVVEASAWEGFCFVG